VVAMTNLKETIASLHKKVAQKDRELLQKDKEVFFKPWKISTVSKKILNTFPSSLQMTELKAKNFVSEQELRNKAKDVEKQFELKVEYLNKKLANQLKEIAQLTRSSKNPRATNSVVSNKEKEKEKEKDKDSETANSSGGSGTESPVTN
jgi:deoxyribodipyrimidine photolyase